MRPGRYPTFPPNKNIVDTKFVFKLKRLPDGTIDKRKVRLVARGFTQVFGEDYTDTFAPVSQLLTVRLVILLTVQFSLHPYHIDVKCAFLNSKLDFELYLKLPAGFNIGGKQYGRARKSIYGLKQAARDWHVLQHSFIIIY